MTPAPASGGAGSARRPAAGAVVLAGFALLASTRAAAGLLVLAAPGDCTAEVLIAFAGATPESAVEIYLGRTAGDGTVPSGVCSGTALELADAELAAAVTADADGGFSRPLGPAAARCGGLMQAVDLETCTVSNLARLETGYPAPVPETGQRGCWDVFGDPIPCAGTGQDGEYRRGVPWPTVRFVDNGDGTVSDRLTGLVWLRDPQCLSAASWDDALAAAAGLAEGACELADGSAAGDWRLPNVLELQSLIRYREKPPGSPIDDPFAGLPSGPPPPAGDHYWSSTTSELKPDWAWHVRPNLWLRVDSKVDTEKLVWPVRGGR